MASARGATGHDAVRAPQPLAGQPLQLLLPVLLCLPHRTAQRSGHRRVRLRTIAPWLEHRCWEAAENGGRTAAAQQL